ncbi:hypothetical protein BIU82_08300 [Arthrobacter sp. SW1]|nr:hypothetical protein BIU82_08300 [Arthrobacter sp. SW1]
MRAVPDEALKVAEEFLQWLESVQLRPEDPAKRNQIDLFRHFALQFATNFLLLVEVDAGLLGTRTVIKYSRDDDPPEAQGPNTRHIAWEVPDFGMAGSYHLEVEVPHGLCLSSLKLVQYDSDGTVISEHLDASVRPRSLGHLACAPDSRLATAEAELIVEPAPQGIYTVSRISSFVVSGVVLIAWVVSLVPGLIVSADVGLPTSAVSVILTAPALLLSWLSRAPEHEIVALILRPYRRVLIASATTLVIMAIAAAVPFVFPWSQVLWTPIVAVQTWAFLEALAKRKVS